MTRTRTRTSQTHAKTRTYAGEEARITLAAVTTQNRKLYALKTVGGTVATAWDEAKGLARLATKMRLNLVNAN